MTTCQDSMTDKTFAQELLPDQPDWITELIDEELQRRDAKIAELIAERDRYRDALEGLAEYDCHYGDNCPTFGSRHGKCVGCKAREALSVKGG